MENLAWNMFSKTGNIEIYLLLKEIEKDHPLVSVVDYKENKELKAETEKGHSC